MRKSKAISILENQIYKLENIEEVNIAIWNDATNSYLKLLFGESSRQSSFLDRYYWETSVPNSKRTFKIQKNKAIVFLKECIEVVENVNVYKPPVENWFSKIPDWVINMGLPALFFMGLFLGNLSSDKQNVDLRQEKKIIEEKLSSLTDNIPDKVKDSSDTSDN